MRGFSAVLMLLAAGSAAWAHDEKYSVSRIEIGDAGIVWKVDVSLVGLEKVIRLPADPIDLSESQFEGLRPDIIAYLRTCMRVEINGVSVEPEAGSLVPVLETFVATGEKYIAHARQEFRFKSAAPVRRATLSAAFFRTRTDVHEAVLNITWNGASRSFTRIGAFDLELTPSLIQPSAWGTGGEFLLGGMRRLLTGAPALCFLLALLLGASATGEALRAAGSFTVAFCLTLILTGLDRLRLSTAVTDSLVAASVVYVAAENFFLGEGRHRWVLTFAFGLVHGAGFAGGLGERLRDLETPGLAVAAFTAGVVLGEAALLLVAVPLLSWIRKAEDPSVGSRRHRALLRAGSIPILALGCFWVVSRFLPR